MSRNSFQKILVNRTIAASSTLTVDLDLLDISNIQFLLTVAYAVTGISPSTTVDLYYGLGENDPSATGSIPTVVGGSSVPIFGNNSDSVAMVAIGPGDLSKNTVFFLSSVLERIPRWLRLKFTNTNGSNASTVSIYVDS